MSTQLSTNEPFLPCSSSSTFCFAVRCCTLYRYLVFCCWCVSTLSCWEVENCSGIYHTAPLLLVHRYNCCCCYKKALVRGLFYCERRVSELACCVCYTRDERAPCLFYRKANGLEVCCVDRAGGGERSSGWHESSSSSSGGSFGLAVSEPAGNRLGPRGRMRGLYR